MKVVEMPGQRSQVRATLENLSFYLLAAIGALLLAGCSLDPEDKNFYYSGWLDPNKNAWSRESFRSTPPGQAPPGQAQYKKDPILDE